MNEIQQRSVPGVLCGKCLGRISEESNERSRKAQERFHPGTPWQPPRVCGMCVLRTIMEWPDEPEER